MSVPTLEKLIEYASPIDARESDVSLPDKAAELVRESVEALWRMYEGRRVGARYDFGNQIIEERVLATRFFDESSVEEVYRITDVYSVGHKYGHSQRIEVLARADTGSYSVIIDEDGAMHVKQQVTETDWVVLEDDAASYVAFDVQGRALIAADIHAGRTSEAKHDADMDARARILQLLPQYDAPSTSLE